MHRRRRRRRPRCIISPLHAFLPCFAPYAYKCGVYDDDIYSPSVLCLRSHRRLDLLSFVIVTYVMRVTRIYRYKTLCKRHHRVPYVDEHENTHTHTHLYYLRIFHTPSISRCNLTTYSSSSSSLSLSVFHFLSRNNPEKLSEQPFTLLPIHSHTT